MYGLKINYHNEEASRVANVFYCNLARLHMTYLGIVVGDKHVAIKASDKVIDKLTKRLDN